MKILRPPLLQHIHFRATTSPNPPFLMPLKGKIHAKYPKNTSSSSAAAAAASPVSVNSSNLPKQTLEQPGNRTTEINNKSQEFFREGSSLSSSKLVVLGAVTVGVAVFLMGFDDHKALAFGPEGPLVEEFWDNMRRYAIYALTVSTGVIYAVFQPILELLKNPISALLVLIMFGGSVYIVSQVLSAMVGVTEFAYDYSY